jgi:hypothetical protein
MPKTVPPEPVDVETLAIGPRTCKVLAVGEVPPRAFNTVFVLNGMIVLTFTGVFLMDLGFALDSLAF